MESLLSNNLNSYMEFKRKIYLNVIPVLFIAMIFWIFYLQVDRYTRLSLIILDLLLVVDWVLFLKYSLVRVTEISTLCMFTAFHLIQVYMLVSQFQTHNFIYVLWSPMYYIFLFIALLGRNGLRYAFAVFILTLLIGMPHLMHAHKFDFIFQFFLSNFVYIIVLYHFQKLFVAYSEADILKKFAYHDSLTKIANRRMLESWIQVELKKSKDENTLFSIIYFDIDHFKRINDEFGHDVGDHILIEVTTIVKNNIGTSDYFGRWGGEEFIIVATNQTTKQAEELAERLRRLIEHHIFEHVGKVTASFGVSGYKENDMPNILLKRADEALYKAKNSGRNTVKII